MARMTRDQYRFLQRWQFRVDASSYRWEGRPLEEVALEHFEDKLERYPLLFSIIEKDSTGLVEVVFGMKRVKNEVKMQVLAVIPEHPSYPNLVRNLYYNYYGTARGAFSYGYDGKGTRSGYYNFAYEDRLGLAVDDFPMEKLWRRNTLITAEKLTELDPNLKYCSWRPCFKHVIDYIKLYRIYPQACEMLIKLGLYRFLTFKACEMLKKEPSFVRWVARNAENIKKRDMAPQTAHNAYRKNPGGDPVSYYDSLMYRCECGREVALEDKRVYAEVLKHTTQERLARYIKDAHTNSRSYSDYLIACDWLELDLSDTKVLFPHDFKQMHDNYVTQYAAYREEQARQVRLRAERAQAEVDRKNREELEHLAENMKKTADKYSFLSAYRDDDYVVLVAQSKEDLIHEGAVLKHCVGRMPYDLKMAREQSIVCFIRRSIDPATPFVTAEVKVTEQTLRVVQCYGYDDTLVPEVDEFTKAWMRNANSHYRKEVCA